MDYDKEEWANAPKYLHEFKGICVRCNTPVEDKGCIMSHFKPDGTCLSHHDNEECMDAYFDLMLSEFGTEDSVGD